MNEVAPHKLSSSGNQFIQKWIGIVSQLDAGRLTIIMPDSSQYELQGKNTSTPHAIIKIVRFRAIRRFLTQGEFGFVESYLDGDWESPEISNVIELAALNNQNWNGRKLQSFSHKMWNRLNHLMRPNSRNGSRRNVAAHYDLGNDFYQQWLDPTMTYSSAYFARQNQPLSEGQFEKYRRIAELLELRPEHHVLEVGCGWGGFAEFAAKFYGCRVTGLTLSKEQLKFASERIQNSGLSDKVELRLQDYRDIGGTFDRIASIEMFEAVGEPNWPRYFDMIRERLTSGGAAALQIITISEERFDNYRQSADFIQRYIFPGGMLPSIEALKVQFDQARLQFESATMFGESYAHTLKHWRDSFLGAWNTIEPLGFDDRFRRMWEMYLAYCEGGFRANAINVGQFKLVHQ
ncbi:MAG TPA: SAM-dependent methyltransferase [Rhodospirillaceae bacterium]|nr:SAM-dependent methyltransferase [Rhodospirillaceae bacterium]